jgi:hypothetical protein
MSLLRTLLADLPAGWTVTAAPRRIRLRRTPVFRSDTMR